MNSEEKEIVFPDNSVGETEKKSVEELAEAFADVVGQQEETENDTKTVSIEFEEVELDEKTVQSDVGETVEIQEEKKRKISKKAIVILASSILGLLLIIGIYLGVAMHYSDKFFPGTRVNGVDCSGKTLKQVEAILQKQVEAYKLTIYEKNDITEEIKGTDIGITYVGYEQLEEEFSKQNQYMWPIAVFNDREIKADVNFEYDKQKLDEVISKLDCMQPENQTAPVNAAVVYQDGTFVIQDETYGTQLDAAKMNEVIHANVATRTKKLYLDATDCYILPQYTKDSAEVIKAQEEANRYLSAKITYSIDELTVVVDKSKIAQWISVDANMTPVIDSNAVKAFTDTLGETFNTPNKPGTLISPTGKEVAVESATLGRVVGSNEECTKLIEEIKSGKTITREPIFSRQQMADGEYYWGNFYVEVDITAQHMWIIKDGAIALETDIVTGKKGADDTPTGSYTIIEKMRNKTLRGRIVNGKPLYITPVSYWMRITWSGVGFHDATWQPSFGGDRYVENGSHGCINMPFDLAKQMYDMVGIGTPVIIHY